MNQYSNDYSKGVESYSCPHCGFRATNKLKINDHLSNTHNEKGTLDQIIYKKKKDKKKKTTNIHDEIKKDKKKKTTYIHDEIKKVYILLSLANKLHFKRKLIKKVTLDWIFGNFKSNNSIKEFINKIKSGFFSGNKLTSYLVNNQRVQLTEPLTFNVENDILILRDFLENQEDIEIIIERTLEEHAKENIDIISYSDKNYPHVLKNIEEPPPILFCKGNLALLTKKNRIAIVGTRNPSFYGHRSSFRIAKHLTENGYIITSGLARGIDTEAHIGCLEGKGNTIAVLGDIIQKIYPSENREIANDIVKNKGLLISEIPFIEDEKPKHYLATAYRFKLRNRIISGLSKAVLIIEAGKRSGTLAQKNYAMKQEKKVLILKPKEIRESNALPRDLISKDFPSFKNLKELTELLQKYEINNSP